MSRRTLPAATGLIVVVPSRWSGIFHPFGNEICEPRTIRISDGVARSQSMIA